ncbi:lipopolysaccharide transport periplasmic protein LptA [Thalassotalea euphylliae]|uniref:Lipopolysaccharide export system protein LptA n=1 Tax=Thalassotalea euphylliae TaxID=1655234 RepID=A0A3E0TM74_9GAMM|nr:lipopolysaccharide transport periplasmic protein LptA [Thalassotalea euphylliae]REL25654.1 lipopolysaccharide transport periplasmic protein LptA [Thalassotalea euphylliae]
MYKLFIKKLLASLALAATLSTSVLAAKIDLDQEIHISAGRQAGDLKNKIASYLDNVVITQGSLKINADLVQVYSQKDQDVRTYVAKGQPATFEQLLEDGSKIRLQANEIRYEPLIYTITISGNALMTQAGSEVSGEKIVYNTLTEQLAAEGGNNQSVTTILKPKVKSENN